MGQVINNVDNLQLQQITTSKLVIYQTFKENN